jgi:hypothetical protein
VVRQDAPYELAFDSAAETGLEVLLRSRLWFYCTFPAPGVWSRNWPRIRLIDRGAARDRGLLLMCRRRDRLWRLERRQVRTRRLDGCHSCRLLKDTLRLWLSGLSRNGRVLVRSRDRLRMIDRFPAVYPLLNADPFVVARLTDATATSSSRLQLCGQCKFQLRIAAWAKRVKVQSLSHDSGPSPIWMCSLLIVCWLSVLVWFETARRMAVLTEAARRERVAPARPTESGTHKPFTNGVPSKIDAVMNPQGLHDPILVAVDRFDRDVHLPSDIFDAQPVSEMPQYL